MLCIARKMSFVVPNGVLFGRKLVFGSTKLSGFKSSKNTFTTCVLMKNANILYKMILYIYLNECVNTLTYNERHLKK
jgi:hypothetical protein